MTDPNKREQWQEWLDEFQGESDRACAVLGPAFLDEKLRELLTAFFVDDSKVEKDLFRSTGPLAAFSARIHMAYALGFLAPSEYHDLHLIRKIRNQFAHELHGTSFKSPDVVSRCMGLQQCDVVGELGAPLGHRDRFVLSIVLLANWLAIRRLGIRDTRRTVCKEVKRA